MDSGQLTLKEQEKLRKIKEKLNPFKLREQMDEKLKKFYNYLDRYRPTLMKKVA